MKQKLVIIISILAAAALVLGMFLINRANTPDNGINSVKSFVKTLDTYSDDKNPEKAREALVYASETKLLEENPGFNPLLLGFYSGIFHENPELAKEFATIKLSEKTTKLVKDAAGFQSIIEQIFADKGNSAQSPAFIDVMWGYYSATNDIRAVEKIIAIYKNTKIPSIKNAAKISLDEVSKRDKKVKKLWN